MPAGGLTTAELRYHGDATLDAGGATISKLSLTVPLPRQVFTLEGTSGEIGGGRTGPGTQYCLPLRATDACVRAWVDADLGFTDLTATLSTTGVRHLTMRTNRPGPGETERAYPPFNGATPLQQDLWRVLPLLAFDHDSDSPLLVKLEGRPDPDVSNTVYQKVQCRGIEIGGEVDVPSPDEAIEIDLDVSQGTGLDQLHFCGWVVTASGDEVAKATRSGQSLDPSFGADVHIPAYGSPPWEPRFIHSDDGSLRVEPGQVHYFVPSPYNVLLADPACANTRCTRAELNTTGRSYPHFQHALGVWRMDWMLQVLLRQLHPDALCLHPADRASACEKLL